MKNRILSVLDAAGLAACGGAESPSTDASQKSQSRQPSLKQGAANYNATVQALYVAYFGRPADPGGLANFSAALQAAGAPTDAASLAQAYSTSPAVQQLIDSFGTSKESQTLYGSSTTGAFVTAVFQNVLGRAPQSTGLDYWTKAIDSGSLSKGDAALAIMAGALTNTSAQGLVDAQLIANRLAVAGYFTAQVSTFGAVSNYSGASAASSARTMLAGVGAMTDVTGFQPSASATVAGLMSTMPVVEQYVGATGGTGNVNGTLSTARFDQPTSVVTDSKGNLFVTDNYNYVIRKISTAGVVTTFAGTMGQSGTTDGTGTAASFYAPFSLAIDANDNLYLPDQNTIRKITPAGVVTTFAGKTAVAGKQNGTLANATFGYIGGLVCDGAGNLFVSDNSDHTIRKIDASGKVSVLAGISGVTGSADGPAGTATFAGPGVLAIDTAGNLYTFDTQNLTLRKITQAGTVSTIAGNPGYPGRKDGTGSAATFDEGDGIAVDASGNVYISDATFNTIRKVDTAGTVTHFTGQDSFTSGYADGAANVAQYSGPEGIWFDAQGDLYVADAGNAVIRKISPALVVSTSAGLPNAQSDVDGTGTAARFAAPAGLVFGPSGALYVADAGGATVRKVAPGGIVTTLAGSTGKTGSVDGIGSAARFQTPIDLAVDSAENVYVVDNTDYTIRKIAPNGMVSTVGGVSGHYGYQDSFYESSNFAYPDGIAIDSKGTIYIADSSNSVIRAISPQGWVSTYSGKRDAWPIVDGPIGVATFLNPGAMAIDQSDNLYMVDDCTVRKIDPSGNTTTLAGVQGTPGYKDGPGASAQFNAMEGLAVDSRGNVYVADAGNWVIRKITPAGVVSTLLGQDGVMGFVAGAAPGAVLVPRHLAIHGNVLYVSSDSGVLAVYNLLLP